jgi:hypothetical protein
MAFKLTPRLIKEQTNALKTEPFCQFSTGGYCDLKRCEGKSCEYHPLNVQSVILDICHGRKIEPCRKKLMPQAIEYLEAKIDFYTEDANLAREYEEENWEKHAVELIKIYKEELRKVRKEMQHEET